MKDRDSQTVFANEEPIFESSSLPEAPLPPAAPEESDKSKSRILLIGGVGFILILVINVIGIIFILSGNGEPLVDEELPSSEEVMMAGPSGWQRELDRLKEYLTEIEPEREFLPRPPVDYEIRLEPSARR